MKKTIWFDANNSPHVLILLPIINEFSRRGFNKIVTARNYSQTVPLLEKTGLNFIVIGKHGGKSRVGKLLSSASRIIRLTRYIASQDTVSASFCHGSRELIIVSKILGIESVVMFDYEYTEHKIKNSLANYLLAPAAIPDNRLSNLGYCMAKLHKYPGLKENLYINEDYASRNSDIQSSWRDNEDQILIVLRPPSTESHYHNATSEQILCDLFRKLDMPGIKTIVLPRYKSQLKPIRHLINASQNGGIFVIPDGVVDGPKLVNTADLCISGGGTMIREAAVLGTPAYSIFTGQAGAVDQFLEREERLVFIRNLTDIGEIPLKRKSPNNILSSTDIASYIVDWFVSKDSI